MDIEFSSSMKFTNYNEITFIKSNFKFFDNTQIDSNQMFIVWAPYTLFLWCGEKIDINNVKGGVAIFREFLYKVRKVPIKFLPSYLDDEKNFGYPTLQIIFRGSEEPRFRNLFNRWKESRYAFLMMRTNLQYRHEKSNTINDPQYLSISGKLTTKDENKSIKENSSLLNSIKDESEIETEYFRILRDTTQTTKKIKHKKISALINVDISENQMKQYLMNKEFEWTYYQGIILKSMNIKHIPQWIFWTLPGDDISLSSKIPISTVFQYEIQGSKFSKAKSGISRGIFERGTSYLIIVHRNVKHSKGLKLNSNNSVFLWKGEDEFNKNKHSIHKLVVTGFKETNIQKAISFKSNSNKRTTAYVSNQSSLLRSKSTAGYTKQKL